MASTDTLTRPYLRAVHGEVLDTPPVWLMRQAGRYLPEYREIRAEHSFLEVCHTPELAREVTLQPIRRYGFDASILFSDILVPLAPMGAELTFSPGPTIANPIREAAAVRDLTVLDPRADLGEVLEAVRLLRRDLPAETALIGFAGAPFTLATYWIEGGKPEPFAHVKRMMYAEPAAFDRLLHHLAEMVGEYLIAQAEAGADAVQLFDTWAGVLTEREFREHLLPALRDVFGMLREKGIPTTYFVKGSRHLLDAMVDSGADVISLDWRVAIADARAAAGPTRVLQGNLDPTLLLAGEEIIRRETRRILDEMRGQPHVFNLGHGILPMTPVEAVDWLLDEIRGGGR